MKSRKDILTAPTGGEWRPDIAATLEVLLDIRDLLAERHTRREKGKEVCGECGGKGWTVDYKETETNDPRITSNRLTPVKVPCSCQPANTN